MKRSSAAGSSGTEPFCLLLGDGCKTASEAGMAVRGREGERKRLWEAAGGRGGNRNAREHRPDPLKVETEGETAPSPASLCAVRPRHPPPLRMASSGSSSAPNSLGPAEGPSAVLPPVRVSGRPVAPPGRGRAVYGPPAVPAAPYCARGGAGAA